MIQRERGSMHKTGGTEENSVIYPVLPTLFPHHAKYVTYTGLDMWQTHLITCELAMIPWIWIDLCVSGSPKEMMNVGWILRLSWNSTSHQHHAYGLDILGTFHKNRVSFLYDGNVSQGSVNAKILSQSLFFTKYPSLNISIYSNYLFFITILIAIIFITLFIIIIIIIILMILLLSLPSLLTVVA